ncbi:MAG: SMC family ATPase [Clostridiales bacterium]|nr:SMC family ATPase [Clostridiales bacterium]
MKPIKIKIKGINSYVSEQEINFEKLARSNVFGIFGETGSGKTTILDSIILALYGVSDRDTLQNIINVNTKDAYVEFVFDMENNVGKTSRYLVRRDFHLRPSGLKAEAYLHDETRKETLAEMPDNVNNKLLEIIGIGKKEFTKCIALPQGEFDRFLSDTPALRKKTLAKLFDLEQFGVILNDRLKNRRNLVALKKATLEEKASIYSGISKETVAETELILENSDKEVRSLERLIARDKKLSNTIKDELAAKQELLDMEVSYSIKQSEAGDIHLYEKQIEYTEKYGDFTLVNNQYNNCLDEVKSLTENIDANKDALRRLEDSIREVNILLADNKAKADDIESKWQNIQLIEEKRRLHESRMNDLQNERKEAHEKISAVSEKLTETTALIKTYRANALDIQANYKKLENIIFDNMDILDKLSDCQSFKTKQDFALFLTITKNKINPDSLSEVENFNIYDEVTTVVHDIEDYEVAVRKEIGNIMKDLRELNIEGENLEEMKEEVHERNIKLNKQCDELEEQLIKVKENIATAKTNIDTYNEQITEYNARIEKIKEEIIHELAELKQIKTTVDVNFLTKTLNKYKQEGATLQDRLNSLLEQKQKAIINIEVSTNNIENYREKLSELQVALKPFNKAVFKQKVDTTLLVDHDELPVLKEKVENFKKELYVLETSINTLREKTRDYIYTKDDYNALLTSITENEQKLSDLKVFINVNKITMDIQKKNLDVLLKVQEELDSVNKQYVAIEKLESLIAKGALLDFVAEEYMGLITNFANSYVYKISKGKYLLNYDGDFNVIDNFNGGIKRTVKTLSGGERFIVSLSLALGISQSIAINNNKNFNFFFIDEGFGNLSENYIEKVLQSFDALIKLNFTVGFITHVEKMQYYLNSRIIVTKDNNDDGSKIEQFF